MSTPQHYFTDEPGAPSARRLITAELPGLTLEMETDAGVFSGAQLDKGTRILLEHAPIPPRRGVFLDLGCGYGPIALALASRSPKAKVWAVDLNTRALGLVRDNAARAGLANVAPALPAEVPAEVRFDRIYSNPPIRIGKAALHELLAQWLPRLVDGGSAYLVVQRNLGSDSLAKWLNDEGFPTERFTSQLGFRILRTRGGVATGGSADGTGTAAAAARRTSKYKGKSRGKSKAAEQSGSGGPRAAAAPADRPAPGPDRE